MRADPLRLPSAASDELQVRGVSVVIKELQILDQILLEISGHWEPVLRGWAVWSRRVTVYTLLCVGGD